jgi:hypothetical protein
MEQDSYVKEEAIPQALPTVLLCGFESFVGIITV